MASNQDVSRKADTISLIACLCIAILFVAMRIAARWFKLRQFPLYGEDICMYGALIAFTLTCALYLATIPTFFNVTAISRGEMPPYEGLQDDLVVMLKEFFVVQFFFWLTLWAVKWSLLSMFKRLTQGLPHYNRIWWAVLIFSILAFLGCCISNFTSCSSLNAWFNAGECETDRDQEAKSISLWFSLAADLATDLLIMVVPIRALWNLRVSLLEKLSIAFIFAVGIITMVTAIIRSVSLQSSSKGAKQVSTTWLILWAAIEGLVAIVVGCLPAFAIFVRGRLRASRAQNEQNRNPPPEYQSASKSRELSGSKVSKDGGSNQFWRLRDTESDKSLVESGIVVTRTWDQQWGNTDGQPTNIRERWESEHELEPIRT